VGSLSLVTRLRRAHRRRLSQVEGKPPSSGNADHARLPLTLSSRASNSPTTIPINTLLPSKNALYHCCTRERCLDLFHRIRPVSRVHALRRAPPKGLLPNSLTSGLVIDYRHLLSTHRIQRPLLSSFKRYTTSLIACFARTFLSDSTNRSCEDPRFGEHRRLIPALFTSSPHASLGFL